MNRNRPNRDARLYLKNIRTLLPLGFREKNRILTPLSEIVGSFCVAFPEANYAQLCMRFGSPEDFAATLLDGWTPTELLRALCIRKRIVRLFLLLTVVILLSVGMLSTYVVNRINSYTGGYIISTVGIDYITYPEIDDPVLSYEEAAEKTEEDYPPLTVASDQPPAHPRTGQIGLRPISISAFSRYVHAAFAEQKIFSLFVPI